MATKRGNVFIGLGVDSTFSVGPSGSEVEVGYLDGGVNIRVARSYLRSRLDQEQVRVKMDMTQKRAFCTVNIAEASLANLVHAWDNAALAGSTLTVNENTQGEVSIIFAGNGPDGSTRIVSIPKAIATESTQHSYRKNNKVLVPVKFEAVGDPANGGLLFTVSDSGVTPSAEFEVSYTAKAGLTAATGWSQEVSYTAKVTIAVA